MLYPFFGFNQDICRGQGLNPSDTTANSADVKAVFPAFLGDEPVEQEP
jgi:hypothetical protein